MIIRRIIDIIIAIVFIVIFSIVIAKARSDASNNTCNSKDINTKYGIIMLVLCILWLIFSIAMLVIFKS